ncbi:MAG: hypothetical protein ACFBWO_16275 [Paracoccaceae bacterium]
MRARLATPLGLALALAGAVSAAEERADEGPTAAFVALCLGTAGAPAPLDAFRETAEAGGFAVAVLPAPDAARALDTESAEGLRAVRGDERRASAAYLVADGRALACFANGFLAEADAAALAGDEARVSAALGEDFRVVSSADTGDGAAYAWEADDPARTVVLRHARRDGRAYVAAQYARRPDREGGS